MKNSPPMGGCIVWWVGGWVDGWGQVKTLKILKMLTESVVDQVFPRGGGTNSLGGGVPTYDFAKSFQKTAWDWKNLDPPGASLTSLDLPLILLVFPLAITFKVE